MVLKQMGTGALLAMQFFTMISDDNFERMHEIEVRVNSFSMWLILEGEHSVKQHRRRISFYALALKWKAHVCKQQGIHRSSNSRLKQMPFCPVQIPDGNS